MTREKLLALSKTLTPARREALVHIDENEPSPGCYATHQRTVVVRWLDENGFVAVTRGGTKLVTTHEGAQLAQIVREEIG